MKKYFTKAELKENAQAALRKIYGFAPSRKDIKLMEADMDGTYIGIEVNGHGYQIYGSVIYSPNGEVCYGLNLETVRIDNIDW